MNKIKILYLITKGDIGGAQKYVRELSGGLNKNLFEAKVVTGGPGGITHLSNAFRPYILFLNDWLAVFEVWRLLRREQPDILHLNSSKAGVIGSIAVKIHNAICHSPFAICRPVRVIFTAHGWVFNPTNALNPLARRFYLLLHKISAYFQDAIINVSEYDRQLALKYRIAPAKKLFTIHIGIDYQNIKFLDRVSAQKIILSKLPPTLHPTPYTLLICSVGRLVKEKNYETFIEAAALLKDLNAIFFVVGEGYERPKLEKLIREKKLSDRFFLTGEITQAAELLKALDVFVMSSIKEGLPYTLLEAMAAGVPAVITDAGGSPEPINFDKNNPAGLVVPQKNPRQLADGIRRALNPSSRTNFTSAAPKNISSEFNLGKMISGTEKIYTRLKKTEASE